MMLSSRVEACLVGLGLEYVLAVLRAMLNCGMNCPCPMYADCLLIISCYHPGGSGGGGSHTGKP
eukprot:scaffold25339_cov70-Attheya_sp.AAC.1